MSSTSQVWETHERIVSETIEEATKALEEEDGQDYAAVMKELRREWELKIIQSGALALGAEVDPSAQKSGLGRNMVKRVGSGEEDSRPQMIKGSAATYREQAVPVTILLGEVGAPAFHP